jgi:hypothetical protein
MNVLTTALALVKYGMPPTTIANVQQMMDGTQSTPSVRPIHALQVSTGTNGKMHVVAHMVKFGMLMILNVRLDVMTLMVKLGTIPLKNASVKSLVKFGMAQKELASKCAIQPPEKNSTLPMKHVNVQNTHHGIPHKVSAHSDVNTVKNGILMILLVNAQSEKQLTKGHTGVRTSVLKVKFGTHGTTNVSVQDGEKSLTPMMIPVTAHPLNSGMLTGNTANVHSENTGIASMTPAIGISGVSTLMLHAKKKITMKMNMVPALSGLVMPLERESMNSSEKLKPSHHNGMKLLDQSLLLTMNSLPGKKVNKPDLKSNVRLSLRK